MDNLTDQEFVTIISVLGKDIMTRTRQAAQEDNRDRKLVLLNMLIDKESAYSKLNDLYDVRMN